ncbi:MAG: ribonuclease P protein component [Firmicutes bacterium]|nr:ribonuclease P protein component [Bacillota bacterium]
MDRSGEQDVRYRGRLSLRGHRLKRNRDFRIVFYRGKSVANRFYVLYVSRRISGGPARVGFSVSKKVGNAVVRNRVKRLLREAMRVRAGSLPDGLDVVIIARKDAVELSLQQVDRHLQTLLRRAGIDNV